MSPQTDYVVSNGTGAAVRSDINGQLAAIVSNNSGATEPATMYAYQWWADTTAGLLKIRNAANNAWVTVGTLADANLGLLSIAGGTLTGALLADDAGTAALPAIAFDGDPDSGIFRGGANEFGIATNGVERVEFGASEVVFNDGGANYDFRIEGDTNTSLFFVDASAEAVGIGSTADPGAYNAKLWIDSTTDSTFTVNTTGSASLCQVVLRNSNVNGEARILNATGGPLTFYRSFGNEAARIDTSGRLLVGTATTSSTALLQVQGNSSSSTGGAILQLRRGTNNVGIINNTALGSIEFSNTESTISAVIAAEADANWNTTNDYPSRLTFSTTADSASSPTERMRIKSNGQTRLFAAANDNVLAIQSAESAGTATYAFFSSHSASNNITPGTISFGVFTNGNTVNANNSYGAISDIKLKENIVDANSQWNDLRALQVRNYNFKEGQTHTQIGLVAQEVELVSPGLVSESPDRDEDGNDLGTVTKSVNYSVLYMKAVKALQEAMERIETLESKVAALESA